MPRLLAAARVMPAVLVLLLLRRRWSPLFPYTTLFRSLEVLVVKVVPPLLTRTGPLIVTAAPVLFSMTMVTLESIQLVAPLVVVRVPVTAGLVTLPLLLIATVVKLMVAVPTLAMVRLFA